MKRVARGVCGFVLVLAGGCANSTAPATPTAPTEGSTIALEAEAGSGDGDQMHRSRASGGMTIHLAPGQRRLWNFRIGAPAAEYAVSVTYSNDNPGDSETLRVELDGAAIGSFRAQDTGDFGEGWEIFFADTVGVFALGPGTHSLVVESTGGDGCVEIDLVTVRRP